LWLVLGILGLELALGVTTLEKFETALAGGYIVADIIIAYALLRRTTWGWWVSLALLVGRSGYALSRTAESGNVGTVSSIIGIAFLASAGLLLLCRWRGAYYRE
jgi:hypothetical protein